MRVPDPKKIKRRKEGYRYLKKKESEQQREIRNKRNKEKNEHLDHCTVTAEADNTIFLCGHQCWNNHISQVQFLRG